jgi:dTDP-4-amino-4,6-dideoxygalactose transaminase
VADRIAGEVCSLPLHPQLADEDVDRVCEAIHEWRPEP